MCSLNSYAVEHWGDSSSIFEAYKSFPPSTAKYTAYILFPLLTEMTMLRVLNGLC